MGTPERALTRRRFVHWTTVTLCEQIRLSLPASRPISAARFSLPPHSSRSIGLALASLLSLSLMAARSSSAAAAAGRPASSASASSSADATAAAASPVSEKDPDLKIILLGDSAVGKSKLVERFLMNDYVPRQMSTYALTVFRHKQKSEQGKDIDIDFWVSAHDQPRYNSAQLWRAGRRTRGADAL